jgi:hypothetical protein
MLKILLVVSHHDFLAQRYYTLFVKNEAPRLMCPKQASPGDGTEYILQVYAEKNYT